jgi:hypothetical protein
MEKMVQIVREMVIVKVVIAVVVFLQILQNARSVLRALTADHQTNLFAL